jgi:iron-sulfur cluster repair protein YtfE (RIC family)
MPAQALPHAKSARRNTKSEGSSTRRHASASVRARRRGRNVGEDALSLLAADHALVLAWFARFAQMKSAGAQKASLVARICTELERHTQVEEEIVYPSLRAAIGDAALMDKALVEHDSAKALIEQLRDMRVGDAQYDAKVMVLGDYLRHHFDEEQNVIFPKARESDLDLVALGRAIRSRKRQLKGEARMQQILALSAIPGLMIP